LINDVVEQAHVLDRHLPYHRKLLDYGERPYWTRDGRRLAFIASNYGDASELDMATGEVRPLTEGLGDHHSFLRVLVLSNGDYLLIGPAEFKDRDVSRHVESELWVLPADLSRAPQRLGRRIFEGCGVSTLAPRITYAVSGRIDPSIGGPDVFECHVTDIEYGPEGPFLGHDRVFYRTRGTAPEPQDFRNGDTEVIFAEYHPGASIEAATEPLCTVRGCNLETGEFITYVEEAGVHNECEGIFPEQDATCLESACDAGGYPPRNLWKLKLDGSQRRARMTAIPAESGWKATNSNVSPDGRWLAYMVAHKDDEAGSGRGLGLLDLHAWEAEGVEWETPTSRRLDHLPSYPYPS
jgi:hypothetical protein